VKERILRFTETEQGTIIDLPTPRLVELDVLLDIVNVHIYGEEQKVLRIKDAQRGWRRTKTVNTQRILQTYGPELAPKIVAFIIHTSPGARIKPIANP
jgi:hypothetical protein